MKILLSAFACRPGAGSEAGGGWHWAIGLAQAGHDVVVLTDTRSEAAISAAPPLAVPGSLTVAYFRPRWLQGRLARFAHLLYVGWQYTVLPVARRLHQQHQFDLIIHLTYGVFRHPSFLGYVGPAFVFGPVGGGEDAPWRLKRSLPVKEKLREVARSGLNQVAHYNPLLRLALGKACLILARTPDTRRALPSGLQAKTEVFNEIGIDAHPDWPPVQLVPRDSAQPLEALFVGRMLGWKGAHFALRGLAASLARGQAIRLTMVGKGPLLGELKALAAALQLSAHVTWIEHVPHDELFALYRRMHCFVFPSLHDSGGNVVLEALVCGLPVICLDLGGPATLVDAGCALVLPTTDADEAMVVTAIAAALQQLATHESQRLALAEGALRRAASRSWQLQVEQGLQRMVAAMPAA